MTKTGTENKRKIIAQNKKAYHDYFIEDTIEAGIELFGTEVKSIRQGKVNLKDCYCSVENGQIFIRGMHVSPYEQGNIFNKDPLRDRRLLLHKREILKYNNKIRQDGYTMVATSVYFNGPRVKIELALCKGKKLYDKREALAEREVRRETEREVKRSNERSAWRRDE